MAQVLEGYEGNKIAATTDNHMQVVARTLPFDDAESVTNGNAYNWNSGTINLTNASTANGIMYAKNTSTSTYIIPATVYMLGNSTSGTGDALVEILRNPTAGTVVSDANAGAPVNKNFGSSNTLTGDFYVASAGGKTITDGTVALETILASPTGRTVVSFTIILTPGASVGIRYTTQASNSSQDVMFAMSVYKKALEI